MSARSTDERARRRLAVALLAAALTALAAAVAPLPGRAWLFAAAAFAIPGLLIALGARRGGRTALAAWALLVLVEVGGLGMLAASGGGASGDPATGPWGAPLAAWLLVGGLGLLPLLVAPLLFAADFERFAPDGETLRRLRALAGEAPTRRGGPGDDGAR